MKSHLVFVDANTNLKKLSNRSHKKVIVSTTPEGQIKLLREGITNKHYINADSFPRENLLNLADHIGKNWYKQDKEFIKVLTINGADLGQMFETTFYFYLVEAIRGRQTVLNLIRKSNTKEIFFGFDNELALKGALVKDLRLEKAYLHSIKSQNKNLKIKEIAVKETNKDVKQSKLTLFLKSPLSYLQLLFLFIRYKIVISNQFNPKASKRVLIFAQRNHLTSFTHLANLLIKSNIDIRIVSSALLKIHLKKMFRENIKFVNLESQINEEIMEQTDKIYSQIFKLWKYYRVNKLKIFLNKNISDLTDLIQKRLDYFFSSEIRDFIKYVLVAEKNILEYKPDLVVVMTDTTPKDMSFVFSARQHGVKSLLIQHGTLVYKHLLRSTADYIASWGKWSRNWWTREIGVKADKIFITGNGQFDHYNKIVPIKFNNRKNIRILLATTFIIGGEEQRIYLMKKYLDEIKEIKGVTLDIRTYGGRVNKSEMLKLLAGQYHFPITIDNFEDAQVNIENADVVISETTTFAFDAMILGKPVIYVNYFSGDNLFPYATSGAAIGAYKDGDIKRAIDSLTSEKIKLLNKNRDKFLKDHCYKIDGKSSERVIDLIEKLINNAKIKNG